MWEYTPLPAYARIAILAISVIALSATAAIEYFTGEGSVTGYVELAMLAALALFAWHPPFASIALLIVAVVGLLLGAGPPYILALALFCGLVVFTCATWLVVGYATLTVMLAVVASMLQQTISPGSTLAFIAVTVASGTVGVAFRRSRRRVVALNANLEKLTQEADRVVQVERDRIADELHNIIAHDLTIVVMHSRALKLIDDPEERKPFEEAIMAAATQAMTDIRRMLHVVNNSWDADSTVPTQSQSLLERLPTLKEELEAAGAYVEVTTPETLPVSNSIEATLRHIATESVTNIIKHSPGCPAAEIELSTSDSSVTLRVWNARGSGRTVPGLSSGYGLKRMTQRVELLGGVLTTGSRGEGWQLEAVLPRI